MVRQQSSQEAQAGGSVRAWTCGSGNERSDLKSNRQVESSDLLAECREQRSDWSSRSVSSFNSGNSEKQEDVQKQP